jgi:hypothetical protein
MPVSLRAPEDIVLAPSDPTKAIAPSSKLLNDLRVCNAVEPIRCTAVKMSHLGLVLSAVFSEILNV